MLTPFNSRERSRDWRQYRRVLPGPPLAFAVRIELKMRYLENKKVVVPVPVASAAIVQNDNGHNALHNHFR